jgi:hypothetical protein
VDCPLFGVSRVADDERRERFATDSTGYKALLAWLESFGDVAAASPILSTPSKPPAPSEPAAMTEHERS